MDKIKVEDGKGNAVYIRAKPFGYGLRNRVSSEAAQRCGGDGVARVPDMWMMSLVVMKHGIVGWEGPALPPYKDGQLPSDDMLDDLEPDFGNAIIAKLNEINPFVVWGDEKKEPTTASGDSTTPESASI